MAIQSLSDVAEHNFRSLEEIERLLEDQKTQVNDLDSLLEQYESQFARQEATSALEFRINVKQGKEGLVNQKRREGQHIIIEKYKRVKIPKLESLKKNTGIVNEYFDKIDILRNLESTVSLHFNKKTGAGKTLQGIKTLRKQIEQKVKTALAFMQKIGTKYEPTPFKAFIQKIADQLEKEIKFSGYENSVYVHEDEKDHSLKFSHYLKLEGVEDDEGKTFPELYIVFTNVLSRISGSKKLGSRYYVTLLYEFATPGKFDIGTNIDSVKAALHVIGTMLELELNLSNPLGVLPHNLDEKEVTKNKFSVSRFISTIGVTERSIEFSLIKDVKTQSDAEDIAHKLFGEVRAMLSHTKAKLKTRVDRELGRYKITFTMSSVVRPGQVSIEDVKPLMEKFGVTDSDKIRRIVREINGG